MHGWPRRVTRGPNILGHLCVAADGKTLAYFSARTGMPSLFLRDLEKGSETLLTASPANLPKGYPALSPDARRLAYAITVPGPRALRPIFVLDLSTGDSQQLCEDCGGRPRQWLTNGTILVETFGSHLGGFVIVDAATGARRPLLDSTTRSARNPRVAPDEAWIAFDAASPGASPSVFVAPLRREGQIPESDWTLIDANASHPFWSWDAGILYYLPTTPSRDLRSLVQGRRLDPASKRPADSAFTAASLTEYVIPALIPGITPVIAGDQALFVLTDMKGDIWLMDI
jgi:Tol biopolymer transport system component